MERLNYEKILFENLSEGAFAMITKSEKDFADWIESIKYQSKRCDELYSELKKYKDAEEHGLFLRLPCKVGDKVWAVTSTANYSLGEYSEVPLIHPHEKKIQSITITKNGLLYHVKDRTYIEKDFGETVFLTKEKAEQTLAGKKEV